MTTNTATTTRATIGTGAAIHLVTDGRSLCGRTGDAKATRSKATCGRCLTLSAKAAVAPKAAAPAKATKAAAPTTLRSATVADADATGPEPIVSERTLSKLDGGTSIPAGARRVRTARSSGALVASLNAAEAGLSTTDLPWVALCVTHGATLDTATRRDAAAALSAPEAFCDACRTIVDAKA